MFMDEWLKENGHLWPNIDALMRGMVSGKTAEWPKLRDEVMILINEYETRLARYEG